MEMKDIQFEAHRGVSCSHPENTLAAFRAAIDDQYDMIEIDTKFTADQVCICLHDNTYNRTCRHEDGSEWTEPVNADALPLSEVKKLDAGQFKAEEFRGTRIPTLAEALAYIRDNSTLFVKLDNVFRLFNEQQLEEFCRVVKEADMGNRVGFTCWTLPYLTYFAEMFPEAELHYDGTLTPATLDYIGKHVKERTTIWIPYDNRFTSWCTVRKASADFCRELHKYGKVGVWLITEKEELRQAARDFGADIIETNGLLKPRDRTEI